MSRGKRLALWVVAAGLIAAPALVPREADAGPPRSVAQRLLGPVASVAADLQWVRVSRAMWRGRSDVVLARARTALELDPSATDGWLFLAWHLAFDRASRAREDDPARRLAWVRAGLDVARRGEASARSPGELALWQGLVLAQLAEEEDPLPWPDAARGLLESAAEHFERAARLGVADGVELAAGARARAADLP